MLEKLIRIIAIILLVISQDSYIAAFQDRLPQFSDYAINERYIGRNASIVLKSRDERMFRTKLREAAREKPNFAGHYIVTIWGCGTGCISGAVIDAKTGRISLFPFTVCCGDGSEDNHYGDVEFRQDSKLIIFSGARNEKEGDEGRHFYVFKDRRFKWLNSVKASKKN